jgi:hypothetical protein
MQAIVRRWEDASDRRAVFLTCYMMMTQNMQSAIVQGDFGDGEWVDRLLNHFAEYYFVALDAYERDRVSAPPVWQLAHDAALEGRDVALQQLLLGVNAHINYDLVLAVADMLGPEWDRLSDTERNVRYVDYCHVNEIIGQTIDAVQDQVLEPAMPSMALVDRLLGNLDERLISRIITGWREAVWENAVRLLEAQDPDARALLLQRVEEDALHLGALIGRHR